ncbi:MAG: DNA adenine methylase [Anaerolineales bacterium]|nr:DNA adenine methylase [Anaerolineales bacterium]
MSEIKSPLRYPGGKSRAVQRIEALLPQDFTEYREPFVGGGSVFIYLKQKRPDLKFWINDLNRDLYLFWKYAQADAYTLANEVAKIKKQTQDGRQLFEELVSINLEQWPDMDRAVRFFVLNRITFSGTVDSGGFSSQAYQTRFTDSSIQRLVGLGPLLAGVKITNKEYKEVLQGGGKDTFTFLDPPYLKATKSKLYGKKGDLHANFNHAKFAEDVQACRHFWLITYDDTPEIWDNFSFASEIQKWELQYGMNNYKQSKAGKGSELFISNYRLPGGNA